MKTKKNAGGARGSAFVTIGSLTVAAVQFISVLVLSRLIAPADFGLIAMVGVFMGLANLIRDFGLPMATLQQSSLTRQQSSNAFWMNSALAVIAGSILALSAPMISLIYSEPRLTEIVPLMGITIILSGIGAQLQVHLARSMKYRALVLTDIASQVAGLLGAYLLAIGGAGYWALVAQYVIVATILLITRWLACRWVPLRFRRGHGSRAMFRSGTQYGVAYFLNFFQNHADTLIIGVTLGAAPLGIYNRAYQLLTAPTSRLLSPLTQVVVPTVNRIKKEGHSYFPFLLKAQFAVGVSMTLLFSIAAGTAGTLIPFLLGSGWERAIPIFQILAIGGVFSALNNVSYWGFIVNQQSKQLMHYNFVTKPMVIFLIFLGSFWGLSGIAGGLALGLGLSWPINLIWLSKTAKLPGLSFFWNGIWIIFCGVITAGVTNVVISFVTFEIPLVSVAVAAIVGLPIFFLVLCLSPRARKDLKELWQTSRNLLKRR